MRLDRVREALLLGLCVVSAAARAATFIPQSVTDQTPAAPLANPVPNSYQPRYISGFGSNDSFTVFFEDRDAGQAISFVTTTSGPTGFPSSVTPCGITDTHFCVKSWPIEIDGTNYEYRGWGSVGNNPSHRFYVGKTLADWMLVSTFTISNAVGFNPDEFVYYGFHDVLLINGTYYAWGEGNGGGTLMVRSPTGQDDWEAFSRVGGNAPSDGPLYMIESATPSGSFIDLGHNRGLGKVQVRGNDSGYYLAINAACRANLSPAAYEAAFTNVANWTWNNGTTGAVTNTTALLSATAEHDLRECWVVPNTDPDADWVIVYDADYGAGDGGKALGYATLEPPAKGTIHNQTQDTWHPTIQAAVDDADPGDVIVVPGGTYDTGGVVRPGDALTNRVYVHTPVVLRSENGPVSTVLAGAKATGGGTGDDAVRCIFLCTNAVLDGFTVSGGATLAVGDDDGTGAGAFADGAFLTNCIVEHSEAQMLGGGVRGGTLHNCILRHNYALFGGGAVDAVLHGCVLHGNGAQGGAAANHCDMVNCLVFQNGSTASGGGAQGGTHAQCTFAHNETGGFGGGGLNGATAVNCIVYYNLPDNHTNSFVEYSCTSPMPAEGDGNIADEPLFANAPMTNYHLLYGSPCIDRGTNLAGAVDDDLEGRPRPLDGNWDGTNDYDMGCYEYDPDTADSNADGVPDGWYHRHGLDPTNVLTTHQDPDDDTSDNKSEWIAMTDPNDPSSFFRTLEGIAYGTNYTEAVYTNSEPPYDVVTQRNYEVTGLLLEWPGASGRVYRVESTPAVESAAWSAVPGWTHLPGTPPVNRVTNRQEELVNREFFRAAAALEP